MGLIRDHEKRTVNINKDNYTKYLLEGYGMASCNPEY